MGESRRSRRARESRDTPPKALARAFGGALFFSLPLLMTAEMWDLGAHLSPWRLTILLVVFFPLLVGLSRYSGFEETDRWRDDLVDGLVAYFVGFVTAALVLWLTGILHAGISTREMLGVVALEAVPASFGAVIAEGLLGGKTEEHQRKRVGYYGELFLMAAGAIFFAFNLAPTEEMLLIALKMTDWHALALVALSLVVIHAIVYAVEFHGQAERPEGVGSIALFFRWSVVGYAIALVVSAYVLWTFGRFVGADLAFVVSTSVVLGFAGSLGAAAARLVL